MRNISSLLVMKIFWIFSRFSILKLDRQRIPAFKLNAQLQKTQNELKSKQMLTPNISNMWTVVIIIFTNYENQWFYVSARCFPTKNTHICKIIALYHHNYNNWLLSFCCDWYDFKSLAFCFLYINVTHYVQWISIAHVYYLP